MKIVFIGSVILSNFVLERLIKKKFDICGVISLKKNKDKFKSDYYDLSITAFKNKITNLKVTNINSQTTQKWLKKISPDIIICIGWSQIIKADVIDLSRLGVIGYHPSLLPYNRGKHPIIWALALGLKKTASTFFIMDNKIDNGKILSQKIIKINKEDNSTSLYKKITNISALQIINLINKIEIKNINNIKIYKNNENKSNYWRKRNFNDGQIFWSSSSEVIHNLVRSLNYPYPNAHFFYKNRIVKVKKTKLGKNKANNIEYGKVISAKNNTYEIKCGNSSILLIDFYPKIKFKLGEYL